MWEHCINGLLGRSLKVKSPIQAAMPTLGRAGGQALAKASLITGIKTVPCHERLQRFAIREAGFGFAILQSLHAERSRLLVGAVSVQGVGYLWPFPWYAFLQLPAGAVCSTFLGIDSDSEYPSDVLSLS
ncbi:unnamed protein product [Effrenium voratum]|nr:unnamed protein product [Effrenium voratum]